MWGIFIAYDTAYIADVIEKIAQGWPHRDGTNSCRGTGHRRRRRSHKPHNRGRQTTLTNQQARSLLQTLPHTTPGSAPQRAVVKPALTLHLS